MSYTILMRCPKCGADDQHNLMQEWVDEDGYLVAYTVHCRSCEHVWKERLRHD